MDVFDIIGPIMIGPSSSHTAGACRIGKYARSILDEDVQTAEIYFSGSFAKTYRGHGTDKAIVAGLMGMDTDDLRIRNSLELAKDAGMDYVFIPTQIDDAHPNTVLLKITGVSGKYWEVEGASIGGGRISIRRINGTPVDISGDATTLLVYHLDTPGMISDVTSILARNGVNIGKFELRRAVKGGEAVMVIEIDGDMDDSINDAIRSFPNVYESIVLKAI